VRWTGRFAPLALIGALAGCGGGASHGHSPPGADVFARDCEMCHSVIGNESRHRVGGDLLGYRMTREQLTEFTREMPVRRPLTRAQLAAVVDYLYGLQQRGGPG
jgi:hypothetical protein